MPVFRLVTNITACQFPKNFKTELTKVIGELTGLPAQGVSIELVSGANMSFGGSTQPCAIGSLEAWWNALSPEKNEEIARVLFSKISKEVGIPPDRMYINFRALEEGYTSFKGTTKLELLGLHNNKP